MTAMGRLKVSKHGAQRPHNPQGLLGTGEWRWGKTEMGGKLYTFRYTVTTRMAPALRRAVMRAILMLLSLIVKDKFSHKTMSTEAEST